MCLAAVRLTYANVMQMAKLAGQAAAAVSRRAWPTVMRHHRWPAKVATSEVVVLVTSQRWNWDGCATHQRAAMFGHALKWHDERDECGLARMAEGAARVGGAGRLWTALCGWIGSSGAASTTSNSRRSDSVRRCSCA